MSAVTILSQDPRLFSAAAHTHNLFLEILFSSGLLGLIAFFIALASTIRSFLITSNMAVLAILLFVLIRGITEASPLNGAPNFVIYSLLMMIAIAAARIKRRIRSGRTSGTPNSQRPLTRHRQNQYGN
jgi:O-antigen ligase